MAAQRSQLKIALILAVIALPSINHYLRSGDLPNHFTLILVVAVALASFVISE